jgi:hypothetical protein
MFSNNFEFWSTSHVAIHIRTSGYTIQMGVVYEHKNLGKLSGKVTTSEMRLSGELASSEYTREPSTNTNNSTDLPKNSKSLTGMSIGRGSCVIKITRLKKSRDTSL